MPSDVEGIDVVGDRAISQSGYSAETASGVPLDSPYAREREADKGLVTVMPGEQRTREFLVPRERILSALEIRYDRGVHDEIDFLRLTGGDAIVVHTYTTNAGIFTVSDVWPLPATSKLSSLPRPLHELTQRALDACGSPSAKAP
ncbi:hypothetical protein [Polyangium mundeleinium]|uniref:Uncharacterized protein n=1 Tax=Polyangium mundeleinium TaxID=2995306 RepID=A0ABT5ELY1_9BACT|nr:hypothetical protein [Polyangium mundeleinium]MDC0742828.1 hypothetical protein [Polyangium mundeleinium]